MAVKRPGRNVRLTHDEAHAFQHALIDERLARWQSMPRRTAAEKRARREAGKQAWWTLTGHVRQFHGEHVRGNAPFLGRGYDEVEAQHNRLHQQ